VTSDATIEDVLAALAGGPVDELDLLEGLGVDLDDPARTEAVGELLDDPRIVHLADDRVAHGRTLTDGLVAWHRITEDEARTRTIELDHDALLLAVALADPLTATVGDELVELRIPTDETGALDPERGPLLDLPDGWSPDLAAGDLVGYAELDDHLALVAGPAAADVPAAPEPAAVDGLRRALDVVGAAHRQPLLLAGSADDDEAPEGAWVLHLDEVGSVLLADHAEAVRVLDRPLAEVVEATGLHVVEGTVLGPEATDEDLALYALGRAVILDAYPSEDLDPGVAEAAGVAWLALSGDDGADVLSANATAFLGDPLVAEALASRMWDLDDVEAADVLVRARTLAARDPAAPGPGLVLAEALVRTGAPVEARDLLARLVVGPPAPDDVEWAAVHEAHGQMCAFAGDVAGAQAAFRRMGEDAAAEALQRWRPMPPAGVGRNDRCPCGSGRKAKQCCLLHPPAPDLETRVPFVWWKLERACVRTRRRDLPWSAARAMVVGTVAVDAHLVEDGALAEVADLIGPLLPDDERELAASWADVTRGLHLVEEVNEGNVIVRDLVTEAVAVVAPDPGEGPATAGDLWLAVLVPGPGDRSHVVGPVLHPPPAARGLLVEALADDPDGQELVDLVSALLD
jgi:hypothetical protein